MCPGFSVVRLGWQTPRSMQRILARGHSIESISTTITGCHTRAVAGMSTIRRRCRNFPTRRLWFDLGQKNRPLAGSLCADPGSLQGADFRVQPTLVPGSLVFVDEPFGGEAVEQRCCSFEGAFRGGLVARLDRLENTLELGAHHAAAAGVVLAVFFRLAGAFAGLC